MSMNENQFAQYLNLLTTNEDARHKDSKAALAATVNNDSTQRMLNLVTAVVNQTNVCDGSTPESVRRWLMEMNLARKRLPAPSVGEIISRTISGPLRFEIERYILEKGGDREAIDWEELEKFVEKHFLRIDEQASLRAELKKVTQGPFDNEATYCRNFRLKAELAYPVDKRNDDQHELIINAFIKGLCRDNFARRICNQAGGLPKTLDKTIEVLQTLCEREEIFTRLGRENEGQTYQLGTHTESGGKNNTARVEEPMEIGVINERINKIIKGQEQLSTKVEKLNIKQNQNRFPAQAPRVGLGMGIPGRFPRSQFPRPQFPRSQGQRSIDNRRCYSCGQIGHLQGIVEIHIKILDIIVLEMVKQEVIIISGRNNTILTDRQKTGKYPGW